MPAHRLLRRLVHLGHRLHARRVALAGFACGIALPLVLAGLVLAPFDGGLSDSRAAPPAAFFIVDD